MSANAAGQLYYSYWGKARKREDGGHDCHLLVYHCLDVAAVGRTWLELSPSLSKRFGHGLEGIPCTSWHETIAPFFLCLHDFGKFDIRFQYKVPQVLNRIRPELDEADLLLSEAAITGFDHGTQGYGLVSKAVQQSSLHSAPMDTFESWQPWLAAVCGHHGVIPHHPAWRWPEAEDRVVETDLRSCALLLSELYESFGMYSCISFLRTELTNPVQELLAGFCSVSDWVASNESFVSWEEAQKPLAQYFEERCRFCRESGILEKFGLISPPVRLYPGVQRLLPPGTQPREIQTLVDDASTQPGLLIMEGATGSGKTEAALAVAWRFLSEGHADSIIFALPTQATADAMLVRLERFANRMYKEGSANLVLAHGKARFNELFASLKRASDQRVSSLGDRGIVQCAEWIVTSRKRVFLGQVGVCTIDQVLLSVLPVRHSFVREFGVARSVLIVDEVHAYDRYMYGLLKEVLGRQSALGAPAIMLSATLPTIQKKELLGCWTNSTDLESTRSCEYPLITAAAFGCSPLTRSLETKQSSVQKTVGVKLVCERDAAITDSMLREVLEAADNGALVGIVCNLVDSAQAAVGRLWKLQNERRIPVDLLHSRYRYKDRQAREAAALNLYGKDAPREEGRILVATQVIEQSLDLDFDLLVSQLCPIDLLFQRLGRLHRHRRTRPKGFGAPACWVVSPTGDDFGLHEAVYGDARILWRTRQMLRKCVGAVTFPGAYRDWIEKVYSGDEWKEGDAPDEVVGRSCAYRKEQEQQHQKALMMARGDINPYADCAETVSSLTRGTEMGLSIVPVLAGSEDRRLLDGEHLDAVAQIRRPEILNMNAIPAPASWRGFLPRPAEDGYVYLPMQDDQERFTWNYGQYTLRYTLDFGLQRTEATA